MQRASRPALKLFVFTFSFLLLSSFAAETPPLIETAFGENIRDIPADKNERVSGVLPNGWNENSGWAKVWVKYEQIEDGAKHEKFLRANISKIEDGACQLLHALPKNDSEIYCRLSVTVRSSTGTGITFGIRQTGAPYGFLWETSPAIGPEWREIKADFKLEKHGEPIGFIIVAGGMGVIDFKSLKLEQRSREQLLAEMKEKHKNDPKNLIRVSRLPLGLQSGWAIGRDNSDGDVVSVDTDVDSRGPSGAPALYIKPVASSSLSLLQPIVETVWGEEKNTKVFQIYSAPFAVPIADETHTASVYIHGNNKGKFSVVCDGRTIAQKPFDLTTSEGWQRVELPFKPVLLARAYGLKFETVGRLWIDGLQVERGEHATDYASSSLCEVSLQCNSPERIIFDDENAEIRWCVTGEPRRGTLRIKVTDAYGQSTMLPGVRLDKHFLQNGKAKLEVLKELKPYGPWRVEAWVENINDDALSPVSELVLYRLHRPHYWKKDAPNSPFGIHTLSTTRHIQMAKAIGINWVRLHDAGTEYIGWYHLERKPNDWTWRDADINRYRNHYMKILGAFSTAPEWASTFDKKRNAYFDRFYWPRKNEDWARYVSTVTKHYRGVIDSYEIWNEPWLPQFFHAAYDAEKGAKSVGYVYGEDPEGRYAQLMQSAYKAAKSVDHGVKIVGINTSAGRADWTRGLIEKNALESCDVVSYHHYANGFAGMPTDVVEQGWNQAIGPIYDIEKDKIGRPIWLSEGSGTSGAIGSGFYKNTVPYENTEDIWETSDRFCRFVISLLGQKVEKVFPYSMHTHSYFGVRNEWRTLVTDEGYLHPSGAAHSAMAWQLEDTHFIKRVTPTPDVTIYIFENKDKAVAVFSKKPGTAKYTLPSDKDVRLTDLFGNRVERGSALGSTLVYASAKSLRDLSDAIAGLNR